MLVQILTRPGRHLKWCFPGQLQRTFTHQQLKRCVSFISSILPFHFLVVIIISPMPSTNPNLPFLPATIVHENNTELNKKTMLYKKPNYFWSLDQRNPHLPLFLSHVEAVGAPFSKSKDSICLQSLVPPFSKSKDSIRLQSLVPSHDENIIIFTIPLPRIYNKDT
jgi:hypothetical protein